ncbi:MAG: Trk system potassium transporter TrkA [Clostridia bacterium]|nr:Trk system potassium transporter TrkA [Clostridia bacterium]
MKIVIAGCGKIGTTVIESLLAEGHNVIAVDDSNLVLQDVTNMYDVMCVCGNAADYNTLTEAGTQKADMFVAVTGSDELNMLSCLIAKRLGAKYTVARIRNPEYNGQGFVFIKDQIDLSLAINPELYAARELFNILKLPSALNIETFARGNFEMVEIRLKEKSPIDGMSLIDVRKKYPGKYLVCVVQRGEEVFIPDGQFVLKSGDKIGLTATPTEIQKLLKKLGILQKQARNVMILGASRTAFYLSKMLLKSGNEVKIIDIDREKCVQICDTLPGAVVIAGDGAEQELLLEEGIKSMDAFVSLTGMDEENILVSLFANSQGVPKVISKVNRKELSAMAEKLGLECIISPKRIISDVVLSYARALQNTVGSQVETLYKLMDGKVEALEFIVKDDFQHAGVAIKDMRFKPNILIAGIVTGRRAVIPSGDDTFKVGDRVIVIAADQHPDDLTDIIDQ